MNRENVFYKVDGTEDSYKVDAESAANAANSPSLEESTSGYLASYIQLIQVHVSIELLGSTSVSGPRSATEEAYQQDPERK